jgi:hypothetical protein
MKSRDPLSFESAIDPQSARDASVSPSERIEIVRQMLTTLKGATQAGQRHLMLRALDILQGDVLRPTLQLNESQVVTVMAAVTTLQHEAARAAPDIALFCSRVALVIDILSISP